ncbi:hypothetical protein FACS189423_01460 [Bacteroidia bacterium]|nr:hypothetical protein FACS189423_01460 [Bacteroidia bacterium]
MKKLDFVQMENLQGGTTTAAPLDDLSIDNDPRLSCFWAVPVAAVSGTTLGAGWVGFVAFTMVTPHVSKFIVDCATT